MRAGKNTLLATLCGCWLILPLARATTLARMDVRELATRATYVVRVRSRDAASRMEGGSVWTLTTFEVLEAWKGDPPRTLCVRLPGGEAAGMRVVVEGAPRFATGEEAILFVAVRKDGQAGILSWSQGTFRIRTSPHTGRREAVQDTAGMQLLDRKAPGPTSGEVRSLTLASLRAQVMQALAEAAR